MLFHIMSLTFRQGGLFEIVFFILVSCWKAANSYFGGIPDRSFNNKVCQVNWLFNVTINDISVIYTVHNKFSTIYPYQP